MATLSDLKEMKEALDAGLVSQAEFDDVKRDYLRAKKKALEANKEFQKKELRAKEEALEANKEIQKKELRAREEALETHKKGISECQKMELRARKEAFEVNKEFQKRELIAKEAFQQRKDEADLRAYALESIVKHGSSIMSEEQKIDLVRDYVKMSGLDRGAEKHVPASKRQRISAEKRNTAPPAPADAPAPVVANQARALRPRHSKRFRSMAALVKEKEAAAAASEDGNYSDDDGDDDSDSDEPRTERRCCKRWTGEDDAALVAALKAGQSASSIRIPGRPKTAARDHLKWARENGSGGPALREYLEETCPGYVYKPPSERLTKHPWSAEEDQIFIHAHREGKTQKEIAAMLPGRSNDSLSGRWREAKKGKYGSAALIAYAAEYCKMNE